MTSPHPLRACGCASSCRYDPVIVFSFSKRECETYALQIAKLDLTSADEKALIEQVSAGDALS